MVAPPLGHRWPGVLDREGDGRVAQVAGAVALLKSEYPDLNANQVESRLKRAADVPEGYDKTYYGAGYLNVVDAL